MILFYQSIISNNNIINSDPIRVLVIGDSIANGTSNGVGSATADTLVEWNGSSLVEIAEGQDTLDANTGSPYPAMANRLNELTNRKMHLVETALGGSEFAPYLDNNNWSTSGVRYDEMLTKANSYLTNQNVSKFDIIRITLGVNDARGNTDLSIIESDAISLIERLNTDFPNTKIVINNLGNSSAQTIRENAIRSYIGDLVINYSNVYAGKDLKEYDLSLYYDGLHLNQTGNDLLGITDAEIINNLI